MELILSNETELPTTASKLLEFAGNRNVFYFTGDIGAGKTTFIQMICKQLGVADAVTSPTFSLVNEYTYPKTNGANGIIYHIDLYRLNNPDEATNIGIEEYLDRGDYVFIEWPQIISHLKDEHVVEINVKIIENSKRNIIFL